MKHLAAVTRLVIGAIVMAALMVNNGLCTSASNQETTEPGLFLERWLKGEKHPAQTLVILDLDDTAITSPEGQWLGSSAMFYDQLTQQQARYPERGKAELSSTLDPLLDLVYRRVPAELTDRRLPEALQQLKRQGVKVIAMTARGLAVRGITLEQLDRLGLAFSDTGQARTLPSGHGKHIYIERGVVFVGHGNSKGATLASLLKEGVAGYPKQVILVDDRQQHLDSVAATLKQQKPAVEFLPVLCAFPQKRPPFDRQQSEQQLLSFLIRYQQDPSVKRLIHNDAFTRAFIHRCPQIKPGKGCKNLLSISVPSGGS